MRTRGVDERDEHQAGQPDRLARDHLDLEQVKRKREEQREEQAKANAQGGPLEPLADGSERKEVAKSVFDGEPDLKKRQRHHDQPEQEGAQETQAAARVARLPSATPARRARPWCQQTRGAPGGSSRAAAATRQSPRRRRGPRHRPPRSKSPDDPEWVSKRHQEMTDPPPRAARGDHVRGRPGQSPRPGTPSSHGRRVRRDRQAARSASDETVAAGPKR